MMAIDYQGSAQALRERICQMHAVAPDTIGDQLSFRLEKAGEDGFLLRCKTQGWMANAAGTLHGGIIATILDQAMGFAVYALKSGNGIAPSIQLQTAYHRPLVPGQDVLVRVRALSVTRTLITLTAEGFQAETSERICFSGSGTYFVVPETRP